MKTRAKRSSRLGSGLGDGAEIDRNDLVQCQRSRGLSERKAVGVYEPPDMQCTGLAGVTYRGYSSGHAECKLRV
jgi:hypothetical protein